LEDDDLGFKIKPGIGCFSSIYDPPVRLDNAFFDRASPEFAARRAEAREERDAHSRVAQRAPSH
jgi:hypothetical protein